MGGYRGRMALPQAHPQPRHLHQFRIGGDEAGLFLPEIEEAFGKRIGIAGLVHA